MTNAASGCVEQEAKETDDQDHKVCLEVGRHENGTRTHVASIEELRERGRQSSQPVL
jgi:hypothetical protein